MSLLLKPGNKISKFTPFYYGWLIVFASSTSMFSRNAAATLTMAIFVFPMSESLGWSRTLIVGAAAVAGIVAVFVSPIVGFIIQKFGSRNLLTGSILLLGATLISIRWISNPIQFYILFGIGRVIFQSPIQIGASTVVAKWFVKGRGKATSILGLSHSIGMGLFPLFAQLLIGSDNNNWRMAWFWIGISVWVIALPASYIFLVETPEEIGTKSNDDKKIDTEDKSKFKDEISWSAKEAIKTSSLWILCIGSFLVFFIHTGVNIHQAAFLRDQGINATAAAASLSIMALGSAIGSIIWGNLLDKISVKSVYILLNIWLGLSSLLFLYVDSILIAYPVALIFGIGLGGLLVVPPVAIANYFGRKSLGAIRGITEPFISFGQSVGAISAGIIYDTTNSYEITFPIFTVVGIIGALSMIFLKKIPVEKNIG
ncbi:MAG: hypothetical protein CL780_00310 [Chloroflexi bacterium]|nr:hypothetical protein [Chloroflexota bacterium]